MSENFKEPDFCEGKIELRYKNGEVCIYGTREGLEELIHLCQNLLDKKKTGHLHLEDLSLLNKSSKPGVIALFE